MPVVIMAPISAGELFDKISILEIKLERIADDAKRENVRYELALLRNLLSESPIIIDDEVRSLTARLKEANIALWEAEDQIRLCERDTTFGEEFLRIARSIYRLNDARAAAKRELNRVTGSAVVEEKSYSPYTSEGAHEVQA